MAPKQPPEIIDLTEAQPREIIVIDSDDDEVTPLPVNTSAPPIPLKEDTNQIRKKPKKHRSPKDDGSLDRAGRSSRDRPRKEDPNHSRRTHKFHQSADGSVNGKYDIESEEYLDSRRDKKRRRDHHSRERSARERRRSYSLDRRDHTDLPSPPSDEAGVFFIDVTPSQLPTSPKHPIPTPDHDVLAPETNETVKLLLPTHVSVLDLGDGGVPVKIMPPPELEEGENYIEYLDYDDLKVGWCLP